MPFQILVGDCLESLRQLPDNSLHCCVTSPPYWGLRDYGCDGQIGLESTPEAFVARLVDVFREVRRVLRDDGTCWVNLGDSYASSPPGNKTTGVSAKSTLNGVNGASGAYRDTLAAGCQQKRSTIVAGLKPKDLVGIPWRVAFALQSDGWWLRQDIIWAKLNPMPESVTDRCTKAHEYLFLLTKSERYYYDAEAVREDSSPSTEDRYKYAFAGQKREAIREQGIRIRGTPDSFEYRAGRNRRSVWTVATAPYSEAHFATYPPKLIEPCILAGTSEKGACSACGAPWERVVERTDQLDESAKGSRFDHGKTGKRTGGDRTQTGPRFTKQPTGWQPTCDCEFYRLRDDVPEPIKDELRKLGILEAHDERQNVQTVRKIV